MATGKTNALAKNILQTKTVTPSATQQVITPDSGYDGMSQVTVNTDANLIAENIKKDVEIFGVTGTLEGGGSVGEFMVSVIDYDGTIIDEQWLDNGDTYTLPNAPTHNGLTFDGWSCSQEIINNTVTINKSDVMIGPMYHTTSGKVEIDIHASDTFPVNCDLAGVGGTIDWGDGTVDTNQSHIYATAGDYTIKFIPSSSEIRLYNYSTVDIKIIESIRLSTSITSIGSQAFQTMYCLKSILIPNSVTNLSANAFNSCTAIETILLPNSITTLNSSAFSSCYSLKRTLLPNSITNMTGNEFYYNYNLKSIIVPSSVTTITDGSLFYYNYSLQRAFFNANVKLLRQNTFHDCYNLKKVVLSDTIETFQNGIFYNCYSLKEITLPSNLKELQAYTFYNCFSLESVNMPNTITSFAASIFYYCYSLKGITIPNGVKTLGQELFNSNYNLTSVIIPSSVTTFGSGIFRSCLRLKSVTIQANMTNIPQNMFYGCRQLTSIAIPSTVTTINQYAFRYCSNCSLFDFRNHLSVPTLSNVNAFSDVNSNAKIVVPDSLYSTWIAASNWSSLSSQIMKASVYAAL